MEDDLKDELDALHDRLDSLRALVQGQQYDLPPDALWSLDGARVRLSHGINPKSLTQEELEEWLGDSRTMSYKALKRMRDDELCPVRTVDVGGKKRIPEKFCRCYIEQQEKASRPNSLHQV